MASENPLLPRVASARALAGRPACFLVCPPASKIPITTRQILAKLQSLAGTSLVPNFNPSAQDSSCEVKIVFPTQNETPRTMQNVERLASAVFRAQSRLFGLQQPEGFWVGELEANSLLGQVRWQDVPPIPIEVVLAPHWFPLNLYSVSAWTRVMMVPLGIIRHFEPTQAIPLERGIPEPFITPERRVRSVTDDWLSKGLTLLAWARRLGRHVGREAGHRHGFPGGPLLALRLLPALLAAARLGDLCIRAEAAAGVALRLEPLTKPPRKKVGKAEHSSSGRRSSRPDRAIKYRCRAAAESRRCV